MPRKTKPEPDEPDLLTLLDEQEHGPPPCPHAASVGPRSGSGWAYETDPASAYYQEWVHAGKGECRRSAFPGRKQING